MALAVWLVGPRPRLLGALLWLDAVGLAGYSIVGARIKKTLKLMTATPMRRTDYLLAHGHAVMHIDATGPVRPHKLMDVARILDGELVYNGGELF